MYNHSAFGLKKKKKANSKIHCIDTLNVDKFQNKI